MMMLRENEILETFTDRMGCTIEITAIDMISGFRIEIHPRVDETISEAKERALSVLRAHPNYRREPKITTNLEDDVW